MSLPSRSQVIWEHDHHAHCYRDAALPVCTTSSGTSMSRIVSFEEVADAGNCAWPWQAVHLVCFHGNQARSPVHRGILQLSKVSSSSGTHSKPWQSFLCMQRSCGPYAWQLHKRSEVSKADRRYRGLADSLTHDLTCSIVTAAAEANVNTLGKAKPKKAPTRLADMPAFHNVTVAELVPHRQGLMYLLEFDQPRLPSHFRTGKASHAQVSPTLTRPER